ncbi:MAG: SRPBCC domain-containing protein, partial [Pseudomonadota bacterium]
MEITGEQVVHAPRDSVYAALHDPAVLQRAIPGCQRFTQIEPTRYEAEIALKIGPIASTFVSAVSIFNVDPPMGYSLRCRANGGGTVGGADGTAHVALAVIDAHTTNLAYHLSATPHGRVAEVSKEMLLKKARTLVAEFISRLDMNLEGAHARAKARHDAIAS